ncbi:CD59 glycoprotein [Phodopus roborovskii]|uniref:MAC-inhibitory protein n=1 Tax=Phodopus roborovskii TaxID=109678 RepID=A0AAU9Z8B1_PHORO|nr:CD59 glycoprotein [Phodopus roborovskii]CAH6788170.1 Cd59b [Phodopus roborovskii]
MRVQRRLVFPLLLLAALCSTGVSLKCYSCLDPVSTCKMNTTCSVNLDSCLIAISGREIYQQCWKFSECDSMSILDRLDLTNVQYRCCQVDMCNKKLKEEEIKENQEANNRPKDKATSLSMKTALLGTSVLAAVWKLCL